MCILSAIAKFLIYLFGENEERAKMGEGRDRGKEWGGKENVRKNGNARKKYPKTQQIWHLGTSLGGYRPVSYIFLEKSFQTTFSSQILYLYLESFKSKTALKFTILLKSLQKFSVFGIMADAPGEGGAIAPCHTVLERSFHHQHLSRLCLDPLKSYNASN